MTLAGLKLAKAACAENSDNRRHLFMPSQWSKAILHFAVTNKWYLWSAARREEISNIEAAWQGSIDRRSRRLQLEARAS